MSTEWRRRAGSSISAGAVMKWYDAQSAVCRNLSSIMENTKLAMRSFKRVLASSYLGVGTKS